VAAGVILLPVKERRVQIMAVDKNGKQLPKGIRSDGRYMGRFEYQGEKHTLYDMDLKILKKRMANLKYELEHGLYAKESNVTIESWSIKKIPLNKEPFRHIGRYLIRTSGQPWARRN